MSMQGYPFNGSRQGGSGQQQMPPWLSAFMEMLQQFMGQQGDQESGLRTADYKFSPQRQALPFDPSASRQSLDDVMRGPLQEYGRAHPEWQQGEDWSASTRDLRGTLSADLRAGRITGDEMDRRLVGTMPEEMRRRREQNFGKSFPREQLSTLGPNFRDLLLGASTRPQLQQELPPETDEQRRQKLLQAAGTQNLYATGPQQKAYRYGPYGGLQEDHNR